jgi:SAM-dependent methyltransferase
MTSNPGTPTPPAWDPTNYDQQWERMAAAGKDPHGEVAFLERLGVRRSHDLGSILDVGCGTGRVAIEFVARGYRAMGTDLDNDMLSHARTKAPHIAWHQANLAAPTYDLGQQFDTSVAAGNVILFVDPSERAGAVAGIARHVAPGGYFVAGFQLQREDGRRVAVADWCTWLIENGLQEVERFGTWDDHPFTSDSDYIVTVHYRPAP